MSALMWINADAAPERILKVAEELGREGRMDQRTDGGQVYLCPMHSDVRQSMPGKCPRCGLALLPEGTRFGLLRHMISSPLHLAVMAALMVALMAAAMMILH
jgi:Cu+-exporting ATPase